MKKIIGLFIILLCFCTTKAQQTEVRYLSGTGPDHTVKREFMVLFREPPREQDRCSVLQKVEQDGVFRLAGNSKVLEAIPTERYYIYKEHLRKKSNMMPTGNMIFAMNTASIVIVLMFRTLGKANR